MMKTLFLSLPACLAFAAGSGEYSAERPLVPAAAPLNPAK